jgi:hypothetical protein
MRGIINPRRITMKKQLLLAAGFAAIMLFSCKKEEEPPTARFWPLAEGNQWTTAEDYSWDVGGGTYTGSSQSTTNYKVEDTIRRKDDVLLWPVIVDTSGTIISRTYYQVTEDSVYLYESKEVDAETTAIEPNNLAVGDEWDGNVALPIEIPNISTDFPAHFKVIDQGQAKVPAGTFDCLIIQIDLKDAGVDSAATQWRAENVGIVKLTTDFQTQYSGFTVKIYGTSELESINFEVP